MQQPYNMYGVPMMDSGMQPMPGMILVNPMVGLHPPPPPPPGMDIEVPKSFSYAKVESKPFEPKGPSTQAQSKKSPSKAVPKAKEKKQASERLPEPKPQSPTSPQNLQLAIAKPKNEPLHRPQRPQTHILGVKVQIQQTNLPPDTLKKLEKLREWRKNLPQAQIDRPTSRVHVDSVLVTERNTTNSTSLTGKSPIPQDQVEILKRLQISLRNAKKSK